MAYTLPSCECVKGLPLLDKLTAIYCAIFSAITNPVELPTCECVKSLPLNGKLDAIFCALLQFTQQGGGEVTLSQITDLDASWIAALQAPLGNFSITANQISNASTFGAALLLLSPDPNTFIINDAGDVPSFFGFGGTSTIDAAATPNIDFINGVFQGAT